MSGAVVRQVSAGVLMKHPGRPVERGLDIAITGETIASVTPAATGRQLTGTDGSIAIGSADSLVLPALADAHDHGRGLPTIAFGAADQALETWIPALARQPQIDPALLTALALAKLARSGVGSVVHCHNTQRSDALDEECVAVAATARQIGVRVAIAVPLMDRNRLGYGPDDAVLDCIDPEHRAAVAQRWLGAAVPVARQVALVEEIADAVAATAPAEGPDLVNVQYCPVSPQWCSDELLTAVAAASARTGRRVHTHLFETRYQREWADATYPNGLVRHLDDIGLLSDRLTIAHGVWLDRDDMELLAQRRVVVSVNTSSNLRLRSGTAALTQMLSAGMRVAVGLDGMSIDDDEDALRELQLTHLLHAGTGLDGALDAGDLLAAATTNGPVAVSGAGRWGRIESGAPADLAVIDRAALITDLADPDGADDAALLLARARARHVTDLVVAGRHVVANGVVLGIDEAAVAAEVAACSRAARPAVQAMGPAIAAYQAGLRQFYANGTHRRRPAAAASSRSTP